MIDKYCDTKQLRRRKGFVFGLVCFGFGVFWLLLVVVVMVGGGVLFWLALPNPNSYVREAKAETQTGQEPRGRNPGRGTQGQEPRVRNPGSGTQGQEPRGRKSEAETEAEIEKECFLLACSPWFS